MTGRPLLLYIGVIKIIIRCGPHLYKVQRIDNIIELDERLEHGDENPLAALGEIERDWRVRLAPEDGTPQHIDYGRYGKWRGDLETYLKTCRGWTAACPELLQKCSAFRSRQVARARRRRRRSGRFYASRVRYPSQVRICVNGRLFACKLGAPCRAKLDGPAKLEVWDAKIENGTGSTAKTVIFDDAKELERGE